MRAGGNLTPPHPPTLQRPEIGLHILYELHKLRGRTTGRAPPPHTHTHTHTHTSKQCPRGPRAKAHADTQLDVTKDKLNDHTSDYVVTYTVVDIYSCTNSKRVMHVHDYWATGMGVTKTFNTWKAFVHGRKIFPKKTKMLDLFYAKPNLIRTGWSRSSRPSGPAWGWSAGPGRTRTTPPPRSPAAWPGGTRRTSGSYASRSAPVSERAERMGGGEGERVGWGWGLKKCVEVWSKQKKKQKKKKPRNPLMTKC